MSQSESSATRLDFLDVARGLAALFVLLEHGVLVHVDGYREWSSAHGSLGRIGVVLFLVISGFIIPVSLERGGSNAQFWLRRFFRLFPAYWLSVVLCYGLVLLDVSPDTPSINTGSWLLNLTMLQGFFQAPNVLGVFWTLQLELVLYAVCSLLFAVRLSKHWIALTAIVFTFYAIAGLARPFMGGKPFAIGGQKFLYRTPLMGILAQQYVSGRLGRWRMYGLMAFQIVSLVATWAVSHLCFPEQITTQSLWEFLVTWGTAYGCFFALLELRSARMPAVGRWLGRISYSVYLLHPLVLMVIWPAPRWLQIPLFLMASFVLAELSYRFIELPAIACGGAIQRRWSAARATAPRALPRVA